MLTWKAVAAELGRHPGGTVLRVPAHAVQHPLDGKMRYGVGLPVGQRTDFQLLLAGDRRLHVRDFGAFYEAHLVRVARVAPPAPATSAEPAAKIVGATALGGLLGAALGKSREAVLTGAALGLLAALLGAAAEDRNR